LVADPKRAFFGLDRMGEVPVHRVPLEKMGEHVRAGEVVDSNDLDIPSALGNDSSYTAPNPSEAIDSDFRGHLFDSLCTTTLSECAASERRP
jgi:hypothetical protein